MRSRLLQALPATLLVHTITSLCTAAFVLPLASSVPASALSEKPAVLSAYTAIRLLDVMTSSPWRYAAVPTLTLLFLTPLLQVLWLHAQLLRAPLHEHARSAGTLYARACLVYAASFGYAALLVGLARLCFLIAEHGLSATHNLRLQQSVGWMLAAPFLLAASVHASSLLDSVQLELTRQRQLSLQVLCSAIAAVDRRVLLVRAGFGFGMLSIVALELLTRAMAPDTLAEAQTPPAESPWLWWAMFGLAQIAALARTGLRAVWLAWLTQHTAAASEPQDR